MKHPIKWRLSSDYIGAGRYLLRDDHVVVGTDYGVQRVPRSASGGRGWKADLGSRCLGLLAGPDDTTIAACLNGLFALGEDGEERWGTRSLKDLAYEPVPFHDATLLTSQGSIHLVREWKGSEWRFDFSEALGQSVKEIRVVNLFGLESHIVAGVVDYDTGIGRVVVLQGSTGRLVWAGDPGPISDLFPAGQGTFVWCMSGYGKFETRLTRLDGHEIWRQDFAGVGAVRPDGSIALLAGSNESPAWDDWEYRQLSPAGKIEVSLRGNGRAPVRPFCRKDGSVYFIGSILPMDPTASRVDYTSFLAMPQEVRFQHLLGIKTQLPIYDVHLHRYRPQAESLDVIHRISGSFSFADLEATAAEIVFCDGTDLVAVGA